MKINIKKTKEFSKKNWWIFFPIILFIIFSNIKEEWIGDFPLVYAQFLSIDSYINWHSPFIRYSAELLYNITGSVRSLHITHLFFIFFGLSLITGNLFKKNISKTLAFTSIIMFPSTLRYTLYFSKEQGALAAILMILGIIFLYINKKNKFNKNILYLTIPFMFYTYILRSFMVFFIIGICFFIFKLLETNKKSIYKKSTITLFSIIILSMLINFTKNKNLIDDGYGPDGHMKSLYLFEIASISKYRDKNLFPKNWLKPKFKYQSANTILEKSNYINYMNSMYWNYRAKTYIFYRNKINLKDTINVILDKDNFAYYLTHRFFLGLKILYNKYPKTEFNNRVDLKYKKLFTESSKSDNITRFTDKSPLNPYFVHPNILRQYLIWFIFSIILSYMIYYKKWKFNQLSNNERNILLISLIGGCIFSFFFLTAFAPSAIIRYTRIQITLFHICILYIISILNKRKSNNILKQISSKK